MMLLLVQVGVPAAVVAFIVPINSILEFFDTVTNISGDGVVTTVVARNEKLFRGKS